MYVFLVQNNFLKDLNNLDPSIQIIIKQKLRQIANSEYPLKYSVKLKGQKNVFRFRIGQYRAIFFLENQNITLFCLKHRKEVYN